MITVDPSRRLGEVSKLIYGHFTEHIANVVHDGLWAEMIFGRKFESPMFRRSRHEMAAPWEVFGGRDAGATYLRGPLDLARHSSPHSRAHHAQSIKLLPNHDGGEYGIAQSEIQVEDGVEYSFRARARRLGPAMNLTVALRDAGGEKVLAEDSVEVGEIPESSPFRARGDLVWMDPDNWYEVSCPLTPSGSDTSGWLSLTTSAPSGAEATMWLDSVSLMPADNDDGIDPRLLAELKTLPVTQLKWPGGCMADNYDWRLGVGPRDSRYPSMDQAWLGWDENDFGTHEFLRLCAETGAEPHLCVNAGSGTPDLAAAWVEYVNGPPESEWGSLRRANGRAEPYNVKLWCVGNEQWGTFERGYADAHEYGRRFRRFAEAMLKVDPNIVLVAVGQPGDFNRSVLGEAGPLVDLLSIHHYTPEIADDATRKILSARTYAGVLEQVAEDLEASQDASQVRVALDEWGWSRAGHAGALYTAVVLNVFHRAAPLVALANRSCLLNVDGVLTRQGTGVRREPSYEVFRLYNEAHRPFAVSVEVDAEDLDVSALADSRGGISVFVVNASAEERTADFEHANIDQLLDSGTIQFAHSGGPLVLPAYSLTVLRSEP